MYENTVTTQTRQAEKADKIKAVKKLKDKGLMQKEIAKELKVTQQYVSKILKELQKKNTTETSY
uniref:MarR family transcriptional regulator n=1 Tax=Clostridium haemolyticum TaxID=84025 RepID=UPI003982DE2C